MTHRQLWMLVGGNGAGKTTFYEQMLKPLGIPFINADVIAKELFPDNPMGRSREAAMVAEDMRLDLLLKGRSFCFETVFSHPSKIDFVAQAKAQGYRVILVVIHVSDTGINQLRIAQRVKEGGHNVPVDKVVSRIPRTLLHVKKAIPLCDQVRVFDNSRLDDPYKPVITIRNGVIELHMQPLPVWAAPFAGIG